MPSPQRNLCTRRGSCPQSAQPSGMLRWEVDRFRYFCDAEDIAYHSRRLPLDLGKTRGPGFLFEDVWVETHIPSGKVAYVVGPSDSHSPMGGGAFRVLGCAEVMCVRTAVMLPRDCAGVAHSGKQLAAHPRDTKYRRPGRATACRHIRLECAFVGLASQGMVSGTVSRGCGWYGHGIVGIDASSQIVCCCSTPVCSMRAHVWAPSYQSSFSIIGSDWCRLSM
jgi:hypothetical protein